MRRAPLILACVSGAYALGWVAYVAKSAAGIDLIASDTPVIGGHHGGYFPGSDAAVHWLRKVKARAAI